VGRGGMRGVYGGVTWSWGPCGPEPHFMALIIAAGEGMPAGRPLRGIPPTVTKRDSPDKPPLSN